VAFRGNKEIQFLNWISFIFLISESNNFKI
jgi:hypothetical protein